jgi:hypothetical protein
MFDHFLDQQIGAMDQGLHHQSVDAQESVRLEL